MSISSLIRGFNPFTAVLIPIHGLCSVSLTLLNKSLAQFIDAPLYILLIQNAGVCLLGIPYFFFKAKVLAQMNKKRELEFKLNNSKTKKEISNVTDTPATDIASNTPAVENAKKRTFEEREAELNAQSPWLLVFGVKDENKDNENANQEFKPQKMMPNLTAYHWFLLTINACWCLICMLLSLRVLRVINIPLFVILRNCGPGVCAVFERIFVGTKISRQRIVALSVTFLGMGIYTLLEEDVNYGGLVEGLALTVNVAMVAVFEKLILDQLLEECGLTPVEAAYSRACLSVPMNAVLCVIYEPEVTLSMFVPVQGILAISSIFAYFYGATDYCLVQLIRVTSMKLMNVTYKITSTFVSRYTHPSPMDPFGWVAFAISFSGVALYTFRMDFLDKIFLTDQEKEKSRYDQVDAGATSAKNAGGIKTESNCTEATSVGVSSDGQLDNQGPE